MKVIPRQKRLGLGAKPQTVQTHWPRRSNNDTGDLEMELQCIKVPLGGFGCTPGCVNVAPMPKWNDL